MTDDIQDLAGFGYKPVLDRTLGSFSSFAAGFSYVSILTGVFRISAAIRLRKEIRGEWFLILNGVLSVLLGIFIIARPGAGLITLVWILGVYAIVYGVMLVALSFKLRGHRQRMGAARAAGAR